MTRHIFLSNIIILFIALLLFLTGLSSQEIVSFDSRFYLFAREMLQHGVSWFPTTYQTPYPDYLGTSTWIIYFCALLMGGLNKTIAVLPSAIAAAGTICLTCNIAARYDKRWAFHAIGMLCMTMPFIKAARGISLDLYPAFFTTLVFYVLITQPGKRFLLYGLLLLSFLFRGPIGFVMPAGVIFIYDLANRDYKNMLRFGMAATLLLFACAMLMSLLAWQAGGMKFVHKVLAMQIFGRIDHIAHTPKPWHFYFVTGVMDYGLCIPLALMTLAGIVYAGMKRPLTNLEKLLIQLFGWMIVIMLGMSIPAEKKIRYLLPMVPAACLLSSYIFVAPQEQTYFRVLRAVVCTILSILPLSAFIALSIYSSQLEPALRDHLNIALIKMLFISLQIVLWLWLFFAKQNKSDGIAFCAAVFFLILHFTIVEPISLYVERSRDFVNQIESLRAIKHANLVFYHEWPDTMPIKYVAQMKQLQQPVFVADEKSLENYRLPSIFICSRKNFDALPASTKARYQIIAKDTLGHVPVYAFTTDASGTDSHGTASFSLI